MKVWSTYGVCNIKSISSCGHEYDFRRMHLKKFISSNPVPKKAAVAVDSMKLVLFLFAIRRKF